MSAKPIDWSQLWYPGRKQPFTADEWARAGTDEPSRTLLVMVAINLFTLTMAVLVVAPVGQRGAMATALLSLAAGGAVLARWLWWRPWRQPLMLASVLLATAMVVSALVVRQIYPDRETRQGLAVLVSAAGSTLVLLMWFLVVWRAQQIESRLAAQAEREQAIEMARRLAAAQLEPHFLFNTLASLQHWVDTRDERASALLAALTGYLRATLPMFKQPTQPLGDELLAVQRYLEVMQARLGPRLAWRIEVEPSLQARPLPSGVLLTLVENAVQHGIEPSLAGGQVQVIGRRRGPGVDIEVVDDGPGPTLPQADGVGLTNVRQRLALVAGPHATLSLVAGPGGGCIARLSLPGAPA